MPPTRKSSCNLNEYFSLCTNINNVACVGEYVWEEEHPSELFSKCWLLIYIHSFGEQMREYIEKDTTCMPIIMLFSHVHVLSAAVTL